MRRHLGIVALLGIAALGGCIGGGGDGGDSSPSPSPQLPPTPMVVFSDEKISYCPPAAPGTGQALVRSFTVPEGYDQILIVYHDSGQGRVTASIVSKKDSKVAWEIRDKEVSTPTAIPPCGGHVHEGGGVNRTVEPGEFELRVAVTGAVGIHLDLTARSTKATNGTGPKHEH